jgi:integrase
MVGGASRADDIRAGLSCELGLGLPRQRFHDLRHATATYMLASGADLRVVMEVLGHSQIHVTANTYAHIRTETTRLAAEAVDALLAR